MRQRFQPEKAVSKLLTGKVHIYRRAVQYTTTFEEDAFVIGDALPVKDRGIEARLCDFKQRLGVLP